MPEEIVMPKFGWTMSEATITAWFKNVGDVVEVGEPLFGIMTEKVNYEVEARQGGLLVEIVARAGTVVPVGAVVGYLASPEELPSAGTSTLTTPSA